MGDPQHFHQHHPGTDGPTTVIGRPSKPRTGMVIGAIAAVLVLVLGLTTLGVYLSRGDSAGTNGSNGTASANPASGDLRHTAQEYVDAVNDGDEAAARALTCDQTDAGVLYDTANGSGVTRAIGESRVERADYAFVQITVPDSAAQPVPLPFSLRGGVWCVVL